MNSSPNPVRRSSYQSAALRSSARASGEFEAHVAVRVPSGSRSAQFPANRLNVTFSDLSGTPFKLGRPCRGDFLVRLLQTGKQFLRDTSAVNASQAQRLGKQLVRRHDVILASAKSGCSHHSKSACFQPLPAPGDCTIELAGPVIGALGRHSRVVKRVNRGSARRSSNSGSPTPIILMTRWSAACSR